MSRMLRWPSVWRGVAVACVAACLATSALAVDISGAGSTFVYPLMLKWAATYYTKTGQQVSYQPVGSGNGIRQIKNGTVTFGASDMPLSSDELKAAGLVQFPLAIGGVVPAVNLGGVAPGQLHLSGGVLADIFLGKIVSWNDPAIGAQNPGIHLPALKIVVVHRADASGTTFNWTSYLSKASDEWKGTVGSGLAVKWPTGIKATGNEGVAAYVRNIEGAIGYVELTYALQCNLPYAAVQNRSGAYVLPSRASFTAAVAGADWSEHPDFDQSITDPPGPDAWPIAGVVFVLLPKAAKDANSAKAALAFFKWALDEGQTDVATEHYVSLPPELVKKIEAYWDGYLK